MPAALADLTRLEHTLWRGDTRYDRSLMAATFAPDCHEFGRSGRRYTRDQMLTDGPDIDATLHDIAVRALSPTIAQVTYTSQVRHGDTTEWANRSSIWDSTSGDWQLRFHQGTALPDGLHP